MNSEQDVVTCWSPVAPYAPLTPKPLSLAPASLLNFRPANLEHVPNRDSHLSLNLLLSFLSIPMNGLASRMPLLILIPIPSLLLSSARG